MFGSCEKGLGAGIAAVVVIILLLIAMGIVFQSLYAKVYLIVIGGEFMYGCGAGVGGFAGAGIIAIAVLILIALGVIF